LVNNRRVTALTRARIRVEGIVQGVGFRPFVHALAGRLGLAGLVGNDPGGVFCEVEGASERVAAFLAALPEQAPPLAVIERISVEDTAPTGAPGFTIVASQPDGARQTLISPDVATCPDCLAELFDPADRRYRYPFVNCTNCGPRFTIVTGVPYDRPNTTMAGFPMCRDCAREYHDPVDRRFHAQPVCCPACGPRLRLVDRTGRMLPGDPLAGTVEALRAGLVVAVKGLGGYHLAADATSAAAVGALRERKHREDKPFAIMVADLAAARRLCHTDEPAEALLAGIRRPIVLLPRRSEVPLAPALAPGNRDLGVMLPYTPLHHLLATELAGPLVLTSGNVSDEPIAYLDDEARSRLAGIAEAFCDHDRPIHIRTDDSVLRVVGGLPLPVRRSRGYAPQPLSLPVPAARPVLGCGAELKSTFCLASGRHAFVSHHIGDLANAETLRSYRTGIEHFQKLFDLTPEVLAHDLHPEYLSTKYARDRAETGVASWPAGGADGAAAGAGAGVELVGVQHHHAHIASCLADNGLDTDTTGPVIGVALDGLGYGTDGTIWGGELLLVELAGFTRFGHLDPVPMPGGTAAITEPWRMALSYLDGLYGEQIPELDVLRRQGRRWQQVRAVARAGVNSPLTSSAGRLFDAVAAILGIRDAINYEGQAAVELEQRADPAERGGYPVGVRDGEPFRLLGADLVRAAVDELRAGVPVPTIAARFHNGLAGAVVDGCERIRRATGVGLVALSGGVFQNSLLLQGCLHRLTDRGFQVLRHHQVPPNDAGISLGQVAVAAALDRRR
jgi:hydrogenase maturation protein HypF